MSAGRAYTRGLIRKRRPLLIYVAIALFFLSPFCRAEEGDRGASAPRSRPTCFHEFVHTPAVRPDGLVRFALHDSSEGYTAHDTGDQILALAPYEIVRPKSVCGMDLAPSGAISVGSVSVRVNAPRDPGRAPELGRTVVVAFPEAAPDAVQNLPTTNLRLKIWRPQAPLFGMRRFHKAYGIPPRDVQFGTVFIGRTRFDHLAMIDCVDTDYTKDIACNLWISVRTRVLLAIELPTKDIALWAQYSRAAEQFFESHAEN